MNKFLLSWYCKDRQLSSLIETIKWVPKIISSQASSWTIHFLLRHLSIYLSYPIKTFEFCMLCFQFITVLIHFVCTSCRSQDGLWSMQECCWMATALDKNGILCWLVCNWNWGSSLILDCKQQTIDGFLSWAEGVQWLNAWIPIINPGSKASIMGKLSKAWEKRNMIIFCNTRCIFILQQDLWLGSTVYFGWDKLSAWMSWVLSVRLQISHTLHW